jgi:ubiquinone/menaquinone biosynthesis C-methylase UbiE
VYGIDLSRTLLEQAKYNNNPQKKAHFIQADMRHLPVLNKFDLLLNLFTSFGYFQTDSENSTVFGQFHQVLKTGAYYVFDYFHTRQVRENLVPFQQEIYGKVRVEQERYIEGTRVQKKIKIQKDGRKSVFFESVKMYDPDQIVQMMEASALQVNQILGDYNGQPFNDNSPRLIIIGQSV